MSHTVTSSRGPRLGRALALVGPALALAVTLAAWPGRVARADAACSIDGDCADDVACTINTCDPILGCQTDFDAGACADDNACTVDDCDFDGCHHIARPDDALVAAGVPCDGPNACSAVLGETRCQGGQPVTTCPDYVDGIAARDDDVCSPREVAYAIVTDTVSGAPVGTVRCWREVILGAVVVDCDRASSGSNEVKVYADLLCPGDR
ncbi:MAG: hypothetical protein U1F43_28125 [Myxococcota bacterium]